MGGGVGYLVLALVIAQYILPINAVGRMASIIRQIFLVPVYLG